MSEEHDFGFTTHTQEEYDTRVTDAQAEVKIVAEEANIGKMKQIEELILPLLNNLLETADRPWIHWPDRAGMVQSQIDKIKAITRK